MKRTLYIAIVLNLFLSCNIKKEKPGTEINELCSNEIALLNSFDTLPTWNGNLKLINIDTKKQVSTLFNSDICCKDLRFNVFYKLDSLDSLKISLKYYYNCDNCPVYIREQNDWIILQNSRGQILFEGVVIPIDSLDNELFGYYSKIGEHDFYPDSYEKVNISLQWDLNVTEKDFETFINQIIKGYLSFINEYSMKRYNKRTCNLNPEELKDLAMLIPINIEIPALVEIEMDYKIEKEMN